MEYTDAWNGRKLIERILGRWIYLTDRKVWIYWSPEKLSWLEDKNWAIEGEAIAMAEALARSAEERVGDRVKVRGDWEWKWAQRSLGQRAISSTIRCAISQGQDERQRICRSSCEFDSGVAQWVLFQNGLLSLKDGEFLTDPEEIRVFLVTRRLAWPYKPEAQCPRFLRFLDEITQGDRELQGYIQRIFGYALTGYMKEKAVFFFLGPTNCGKSVLLDTMLRLFGSYGHRANRSLFLRQENNEGLWESGRLGSARLVVAGEPSTGSVLNEGLLKELTGNFEVAVRQFHHAGTGFQPQCKLVLESNNRPHIQDQDSAIWERLHVIEFHRQFQVSEQDPDLRTKLLEEGEGILAWCVVGAEDWQKEGLLPPESVAEIRATWKKEASKIAPFIDECCLLSKDGWVFTDELYRLYSEWAIESGINGAQRLNKIVFGRAMADEGFQKGRDHMGRKWHGLNLVRRPGSRRYEP